MSTASSKSQPSKRTAVKTIPWHPVVAVVFLVVVYVLTQLIAAQVVALYPALHHWTKSAINSWLNNSIFAQFFFVLLVEGLSVFSLHLFLRHYRQTFKRIGLLKPKLEDILYALGGYAVYFPVLLLLVDILSHFIPGFDVNQAQQIGFTGAGGAGQLLLVFISLVVLPPIVEELLFRGFLFTSLRAKLSFLWAGLITSVLFAAPHLLEGGSSGLLWIGAIDTFILSMVLVWLREKTGRLSAGMGLHALKNLIAFAGLFLHVR